MKKQISKKSKDDFQRLWAPWRISYISKIQEPGCIFCKAKRSASDLPSYVVARGRLVFCMLNRYPYNPGHVMVTVYRHIGDWSGLTSSETLELFSMINTMLKKLKKKLKPHGFNIGVNLGRVAGAGIPGHMHIHIVPRWSGDTNFMPVTGRTKVMSQSLEELYKQLRCA
jgi:ATP adenylyltransferase